MGWVDSHCHINFPPLVGEIDRIIADAADNDVSHMLCVAVNLEDLDEVMALARRYRCVFASVGVHPNEREGREPDADELAGLAAGADVVAVGETGLDYYRSSGDLDWQRERFRRHIAASRLVGKPLIVHSRNARRDTLSILESEAAADAGGVMHCFAEDWDTARRALDLGFYISFSGIVTFRNAAELRDVARRIPLERLLVETDAPYLAPVPYRGKTNRPAYVRYTGECLADLKGVEVERLKEQTRDNFFRLFATAAPDAT